MKLKLIINLLLSGWLLLGSFVAAGQGVAVNNTGTSPDPSAQLDIQSTQKGLLIPRLTTEQREAIVAPAKALLIFNISLNRFEVNTGTTIQPVWDAIVTGGAGTSPDSTWRLGLNQVTGDPGKLGIQNANALGLFTNNVLRLYIDSTQTRIGINTNQPKTGLHIATTDALILPTGTTAQRPVQPVQGMIRFNSESGKLEGYTAQGWKSLQ